MVIDDSFFHEQPAKCMVNFHVGVFLTAAQVSKVELTPLIDGY